MYKFHSSDDESETPSVGLITYKEYKKAIDFNVISVHINKKGKRDFIIVEFDWYSAKKTLNILFEKFTGSAHEQIFHCTQNVDHGCSIIHKVDPMDGTIYWTFNTIHDHFPEDDTVLVEWYGMTEPNNKSWIKPKDLCEPYCEKNHLEDEIMMKLLE